MVVVGVVFNSSFVKVFGDNSGESHQQRESCRERERR